MADLKVTIAVIANVLCVVGIVVVNKYLAANDGFNFMVFLSFLNFAVTAVSMRVLLYTKAFTYAPAPMTSILPVAVTSLLSVAFMNLNLSFNSVGFYQLSKLACIPCTLFIQYITRGDVVSRPVFFCLLVITVGVGIATVYDVSINTIGLIFGTLAVLATTMAQINTNLYQKRLDFNAMQMLHHTSPLITFGMLIMCPIFDDVNKLTQFQFTSGCILRIIASCVLAVGVNISNYLVLGKLGPLTYQVLGHLKTIVIIVIGFTFFYHPIDTRNLIGIFVAFIGVVIYTELDRKQKPATALPK